MTADVDQSLAGMTEKIGLAMERFEGIGRKIEQLSTFVQVRRCGLPHSFQ